MTPSGAARPRTAFPRHRPALHSDDHRRAWEHLKAATTSSTLASIFYRALPPELRDATDALAHARTRSWVALACARSLAARQS